jgi:uncharacterized protein YdaU (DUF1376 family)
MSGGNLRAEWFWTDRWVGSRGFLLPMEARGIYREMLTQAWRRGAELPNDHQVIRRAIGATLGEWRRNWKMVAPFWRVEGGVIFNETQRDIYRQSTRKAVNQKNYRERLKARSR